MRIYVKRENYDKGIWMELPVAEEAAEQVRRELKKQHPSVMMPYVAEVESGFSEIEKGLIGELVFQGDNLETFNRLAGSLDALSREEGLLFEAAYRMEAPQSSDQILKTLGHLGSYSLHPEIKSLEELGRYLKQEEAAQIPEELNRFVDYQEIGRIWQGDHGFLTEGGFVEKRREPAVQAGVEEQKTEKRPGIFAVTLIRDSFKDRYVRFTLPLPETELAEKKRQAGLMEEIPERVEISAAIDGLLEHLPPGSTLEELNQAAKVIEELEVCSGIDWKLTLAALERRRGSWPGKRYLTPFWMDLEQKAIERVRTASQMSFALYGSPLVVTDSGGKDSCVCREIVRRAGIPYDVQHNLTTADAPQTIYYVRETFRKLEEQGVSCRVNYPMYKGGKVTMWTLIPMKKFPPTRLQRYCCQVLKEATCRDRFITTGVRWAESVKRKNNRGVYENFTANPEKKIILNNDNDDKEKKSRDLQRKNWDICGFLVSTYGKDSGMVCC